MPLKKKENQTLINFHVSLKNKRKLHVGKSLLFICKDFSYLTCVNELFYDITIGVYENGSYSSLAHEASVFSP